jgi:hypothetical protein
MILSGQSAFGSACVVVGASELAGASLDADDSLSSLPQATNIDTDATAIAKAGNFLV